MTKTLWSGRLCIQLLVMLVAAGMLFMVSTTSTYAQDDEWGDFGDDFGEDEWEDEWEDEGGDDFGEDEWGDEVQDDTAVPDHKISVYNPLHPDKDPFFPIVFQKPRKIARPKTDVGKRDMRPVPEPIVPEIELSILCIVGNAGKRMALIEFQGTPQEMRAGEEVEGNFKIMDIKEDAVEIYSYRTRRRKTFKIGG